ncbi:alpha/beta fold hydrolase [Marinobacterium aestuariivivens]|uniref:Alpha/beta fold hydrolase n=1 Tax=Marinobacterium aestuariivivens TaxID=1698799 RepID=A0ABW2A7F1_9GAMM
MMRAAAEFRPRGPTPHEAVPWVLLRGLVREKRHWGDLPQQLANRLGTRVYCPDLPGNGALFRETSPLRLEQTLETVRQARDDDGPVNLLGLSMGGMVASLWACHYPHEISGLVLINSSFGDLSRPWQRIRPRALLRLLGALFASVENRERAIYRLTCHLRRDEAATLAQWCRFAHECPVSPGNFLRQLIASARCRTGSEVPIAPALVLASDADRLADRSCSAAIARRWGAPLLRHPDAGHDLPHDDPDWMLEKIAHWLALIGQPVPPRPGTPYPCRVE